MVACAGAVSSGRGGNLNYAAGVRFLKRLVIWLRWPAVVVVGLLVARTVAAPRWWCSFEVVSSSKDWEVTSLAEGLYARQVDLSGARWVMLETGTHFYSDVEPRSTTLSGFLYLPRVQATDPFGGGLDWFVDLPTWLLASAPALLAAIGFILKRREQTPGQCQRCRHTLAGAAVCPECGTPAPTAAA